MIKPTIGRVVLYWPSASDASLCKGGDQPLPALIAHVWGDNCINIGGFDMNGVPFQRCSVFLNQDENTTPEPGHAFAEWMPYQKAVASAGTCSTDSSTGAA